MTAYLNRVVQVNQSSYSVIAKTKAVKQIISYRRVDYIALKKMKRLMPEWKAI